MFTSSILINVYIFPKLVNISSTWSVVTASTPHPNEFICTNSRLSCLPTKSAAAYNLEWNIHWSTTRSGLSGKVLSATLSSVKTHIPKLVINVSIPWFISGSIWYGLPARTIPLKLFFSIYSIVSLPLLWISCLHFWYSASAFAIACFSSFFVKLYSLNSGNSIILCINCFGSNGKNGFMNFISSDFNSSTLFFRTSEYEITIGQLYLLFASWYSFLEYGIHG